MGLSAVKATVTYDCVCSYCERSLISSMGTYEDKPKTKRELNKVAHRSGWIYDEVIDKNVCTDMACRIKRCKDRGLE